MRTFTIAMGGHGRMLTLGYSYVFPMIRSMNDRSARRTIIITQTSQTSCD